MKWRPDFVILWIYSAPLFSPSICGKSSIAKLTGVVDSSAMRLSFWFTCAALFGSWAAFASAEAPQSVRDSALELRQAQQQLAADFGAFSATHAQDAPEARQQALIEFQKRTQSRVEGLWLKARVMARANAAFETPLIWQVEIPENASAAMEESLVQRAQIVNQLATISNAMRAAPPEQKQAVMEEWQEKSQSVLAAFRAQVTQGRR